MIAQRALFFVVAAPVCTLLGLAALPYYGLGAYRGDHSGDGSLPFALGALGALTGLAGSAVFGTAACLAGAPAPLAYPVAYYVTVGVAAQFMV